MIDKTYQLVKLLNMINKKKIADLKLKELALKSGITKSTFYDILERLNSLRYITRKSDGEKYFNLITLTGKETLKEFGYMLGEKFRKMA